MSQVKTKSPTSEERWGVLGLINGGVAHPFKLAFREEGNCPVTQGRRPRYSEAGALKQERQKPSAPPKI